MTMSIISHIPGINKYLGSVYDSQLHNVRQQRPFNSQWGTYIPLPPTNIKPQFLKFYTNAVIC